MASGYGEFTSMPPGTSSSSDNNGNDVADFECNICFELAQDPIVTLCGHLYCWPCLYRWLNHHSNSHECPVCKALIQEEKLVPLYGRGKSQADPRSKTYPGMEIPRRPAGQRPETAPPPQSNSFLNYGFGLMGGFVPMATARIGNFTLSGGLSLIPPFFSIPFYGFPVATLYGTTSDIPSGFHSFHGGLPHGYPEPTSRGQQADQVLRNLLFIIAFLVFIALVWW
ncbi:hypothetical protein K2173_006206 [Erythroxylum novogranatense]|uniref:E3 ubiquitin-protein ligase RMA n=1 Tax=Erythroxylum novogranatense TaxID=1862640 RepID=A0AAV8TCD4_9ROSI|nr:hypothetical protein K2173_006206 [Erythroxylum novogranatense]